MPNAPRSIIADPDRLAALQHTGLLDTPAELEFDRFTKLATRLLNVPVCLISLVDDHRQFFKSAIGLPEPWCTLRETPLSHSFCQHVVTSGLPLVVTDARVSAIVCNNGAVADLGVIAYLGIPLKTSGGQTLGAFCAIDVTPRTWTADEQETLATLAEAAIGEIELRRELVERRSHEAKLSELGGNLQAVLDAVTHVGICATDRQGVITLFNAGAERLLGYKRGELIGRHASTIFRLEPGETSSAFAEARRGFGRINPETPTDFALLAYRARRGKTDDWEWKLARKDGTFVTVSLVVSAVRDFQGNITGFLGIAQDVSSDHQMRRLAALAENSGDFIAMADLDQRVTFLNVAGMALVGIDSQESAARTSISDYLTDETVTLAFTEAVPTVMKRGQWHGDGRLRHFKTGRQIDVQINLFAILHPRTQVPLGLGTVIRDVTEQTKAEEERKLRSRLAEMRGDLGALLTRGGSLRAILMDAASLMQRRLDVAFLRIWTLDGQSEEPVLQASAGVFTQVDGPEAMNCPGWKKILRIVRERSPVVIPDVVGDPEIEDQDWVSRERIVSYAGYPLMVEDRLVGVFSTFLRRTPSEVTLQTVSSIAADIAMAIERKHAEAELHRSEARKAAILESALDGIITIDHRGCVLEFNPASERIFGRRKEDVLGGRLDELIIPPSLREQHRLGMQKYLTSGVGPVLGKRVVLQGLRADGSEFPIELAVTVVPLDGPQIFTAYLRDITEPRKAETLLKDREIRLRSIIENAVDGIIVIGSEGIVETFNQAAERIFGYPAEEILGRNVEILMPARFRGQHGGNLAHSLKTGVGEIIGTTRELVGLRKDGLEFPLELSISLMMIGQDAKFTGIVRDVTERKHVEEQLKSSKESAEAANRAKSEFLANMSHEVRTPMAAVVGFADMLLDPKLSPAQRDQAIQAIRRNGQHLMQIIDDILDLSKIEAGKMELERISYSPWQVVLEVESLLRVRAEEKKVRLAIEPVGTLPTSVTTDPVRVRQILINFVSNAIKFTPTGRRVYVLLGSEPSPDPSRSFLVYKVEDEGIGIAEDQLELLFQPFRQADSSMTRKYGGTGLGLSISKRLAEALGGNIEVESRPDRGSCFTVRIPVDPPDKDLEWIDAVELTRQPAVAAPRQFGTIELGRRACILVAEDSPDIQRVLDHYLTSAGLEVEFADNGRIAVEMATSRHFDLILMDMQMPELDGYGATSSLRQSGFVRPIVALTAHALREDRDRCLRAGCSDYLTKPVQPDALFDMLSRYLDTTKAGAPESANFTLMGASSGQVSQTLPPSPADDFADEAFLQLVLGYVSTLPQRIAEMRSALGQKNLDQLRRLAHQSKGVGGMYGFPEITEAAALLEEAILEGQDAALVAELLADFEFTCTDARHRTERARSFTADFRSS